MPFFNEHWGMGAGFGGFGLIFMLLGVVVMALVVFAILRLLIGSNRPGPTDREDRRALSILEKRFANGEIDEAEYNERRRILEGRDRS